MHLVPIYLVLNYVDQHQYICAASLIDTILWEHADFHRDFLVEHILGVPSASVMFWFYSEIE